MVGTDPSPKPPRPDGVHGLSPLLAAVGCIWRKERDFCIPPRRPRRRDAWWVAAGTQEPTTPAETGRGHPGNRGQRK